MSASTSYPLPADILNRFDENSNKAVKYAIPEAYRMNQLACTTADLLLGLIRAGTGQAFEKYRTTESWGFSNLGARRIVTDVKKNEGQDIECVDTYTECLPDNPSEEWT